MIGYAVLREIVGADFFGAVAGFDLSTAFGGERGLALLLLLFVQARAKNTHGLRAIFDLRLFVLLRHDQSAGNVRDAHGGIGGVDGLAARAGRAEGVDAQILGFDLDIDFVGFGENRDGCSRSVNASLRFGGGNALDAVHATFIFQFGINLLSLDRGDDFLEAAQ